eukprot:7212962-Alexandrium_andersonii.AAC.1
MGLSKRDFYPVTCPGHPRAEAFGRHKMTLPFRPPHELLEEDAEADPGMVLKVQEKAAELPPAYHNHPVVEAAGTDVVVPLQLYLDGVPYSEVDSVVGIWAVNLATQGRYFVGL